MKIFIAIKIGFCCLLPFFSSAQTQIDSIFRQNDSLENVVVMAYGQQRSLLNTPAAISIVTQAQLQRFNNTSLLPSINMQPGVVMEERSPGSYRLSVRGSSLRAPFGVRNVKVYVNDLIFTDPGGGTYLNQLGLYNVASAEIVKGPPGSMYGAGTGGALLLQTEPKYWQPAIAAGYSVGSYGLQQVQAKLLLGNNSHQNVVTYQHQNSDGYREQSKMQRDVITYESRLQINNKQKLSVLAMYSNLFYQTPGGLTLSQYQTNKTAARPRAGTQPSAQEARAAIYQNTFYTGIANQYQLSPNWRNSTSIYGAFTWFNNPGIRVYEKRIEPHFGGRTVFTNQYTIGNNTLKMVYGAEAQKGIFTVRTYKNKNGQSDTLLTDDEVSNWRYSVFLQSDITLHRGWILTAGASFNTSFVGIARLNNYPVSPQERSFGNIVSPRLSLLKNIGSISVYGLVSHGFSPPTTSELIPSNGSINSTLNAEKGINVEMGSRGMLLKGKLRYDVSLYWFRLQQAISQRRDANGNDFFVNTGGTKQQGIEAQWQYQVLQNRAGLVRNLYVGTAYTYQHFIYNQYKVLSADYSGKYLPGVPKQVATCTVDITSKFGIYSNITYSYTDQIALNDGNSEWAKAYYLLSLRVGYKKLWGKHYPIETFIGVDNLGNVSYSLGNDINAAAGRYYNAAAGRNFVIGWVIKWQP